MSSTPSVHSTPGVHSAVGATMAGDAAANFDEYSSWATSFDNLIHFRDKLALLERFGLNGLTTAAAITLVPRIASRFGKGSLASFGAQAAFCALSSSALTLYAYGKSSHQDRENTNWLSEFGVRFVYSLSGFLLGMSYTGWGLKSLGVGAVTSVGKKVAAGLALEIFSTPIQAGVAAGIVHPVLEFLGMENSKMTFLERLKMEGCEQLLGTGISQVNHGMARGVIAAPRIVRAIQENHRNDPPSFGTAVALAGGMGIARTKGSWGWMKDPKKWGQVLMSVADQTGGREIEGELKETLKLLLDNDDFIAMLHPTLQRALSGRTNKAQYVGINKTNVVQEMATGFPILLPILGIDPRKFVSDHRMLAELINQAFNGNILTTQRNIHIAAPDTVVTASSSIIHPSAITSIYAPRRVKKADVARVSDQLLGELTEQALYEAAKRRGKVDPEKIIDRNREQGIVPKNFDRKDMSKQIGWTLFGRAVDEWLWIYRRLLPSIPGDEIRVRDCGVGAIDLPEITSTIKNDIRPYTYEPFLWSAGDPRVQVRISDNHPAVIKAIREFNGKLVIPCPWLIDRMQMQLRPGVQKYVERLYFGSWDYVRRIGDLYNEFFQRANIDGKQIGGAAPSKSNDLVPLVNVVIKSDVTQRITLQQEDIFTAPIEGDNSIVHAQLQEWGSESGLLGLAFTARAVASLREDGHGYLFTHHREYQTSGHLVRCDYALTPEQAKAFGLELVRDAIDDVPLAWNLVYRKVGPTNDLVKTLAVRAEAALARWRQEAGA